MSQNEPASDADQESAEERALLAEVSYGLLAAAFLELAREFEKARPGAFHAVNLELMRGVVRHLTEMGQELPDGVVAQDGKLPPVFGIVAARLRATMLEVESEVSGRRVH